ncbi:Type-1 restriction enzyme R protein [Chryseobacterium taklimakanense]|uniref:Type-1 restriction enzyme R protein n=1 Tax=Chryseobacterium taklimakanense TaxID=536441 RepID=A0A239WDX2_9FLAO|nr:DEAD/DEAH box helicase family protein [Chryseobacterium taklimakanense]SNV32697.1 Type-1 restriction enzyme R protein [Chryseobacterium taklimakanense]
MPDKSSLSERDICTKYISPAIENAGWDKFKQYREEVNFTDGRIIVRGKLSTRGKRKRADYILYYKPNIPIGIIEVKENNHSVGAGMQQALEYADILQLPFVFSTNGNRFLFHDKTNTESLEQEIELDDFPSPEVLWEKYLNYKGISSPDAKNVVEQDYYFDGSGKAPRYYQQNAVNLTLEAIAKGQDRILLVMATGTGKTYTAFQIVHRLWKSRTKKRILFLADRNALIDQTKRGDFKHFKDKMTIVQKRQVDKSYEVYLAIYQGLTGSEEEKNIFKQFSPDFFDLIVIDECHRGSAKEDSAWREVLTYFKSATQIGLTATPKETEEVSNSEYFGDPVYTYSLKQGIEDGFLAPYQVIRVTIDVDAEGWRPEKDKTDKAGNLVEDRIYNRKDYDRNLVIDERTQIVAQKVTEFLKNSGRFQKTIVFCRDVDHAERMRSALANLNSDLVGQNHKYVMRITGDNDEGKRELDNFIDPEQTYPVIATTSELMTTGVDAQTCKLIVLDTEIGSMTKFKQIVGRGTRVNEEFGKLYFTIMDFRNATDKFADKDFDGDPVRIKEIKGDEPITGDNDPAEDDEPNDVEKPVVKDPPENYGNDDPFTKKKTKLQKIYINGVDVTILNSREMYFDKDGKPVTMSMKDYTKSLLSEKYESLDHFLNLWKSADRKEALIEELNEQGIPVEELLKAVNRECDLFDIICHVAFDQKPLTRKERANNVKKRNYFTKYGEKARAVIEALIEKYADEGIENIESMEVLKLNPLSDFGSPLEIVKSFGGKNQYLEAIKELENEIYNLA